MGRKGERFMGVSWGLRSMELRMEVENYQPNGELQDNYCAINSDGGHNNKKEKDLQVKCC